MENAVFMKNVKTFWDTDVDGIGMWRFYHKMNRFSNTLSARSRKEFGDIFHNVRMSEEQAYKGEANYILHRSDATRSSLHDINVKYINFLKLEDTILKYKT